MNVACPSALLPCISVSREVTRPLLGRAAANGALSAEAIDAALTLAALRPSRGESRDFAVRALRFAGVLSFAAGMIFLVAFNWDALALYGRFALVELPLLAALAFAFAKGTDHAPGKLALLFAVLMTGALLALFGQTYQTGADLWELFLAWAVLTLPWAVAGRYAPCWAVWLMVLNLAAALYGESPAGWSRWLAPFALDLTAYLVLEIFPVRWLRRAVMAAAMAFGTLVMIGLIFDFRGTTGLVASLEILLFLAASAALGGFAYTRKNDTFAFAVLALAWVAVTTSLIGRAMERAHAGVGSLFVIALYVIGASTGAIKAILYISRHWQAESGRQ
jgi:uncharacterized membrane protein